MLCCYYEKNELFFNASTKQIKYHLTAVSSENGLTETETYTEKPNDTVVKKAAVGADNPGPSPSSVTDELGVSCPTSLCLEYLRA